jgi:TrmH family RNA methyltransferase
MQAAHFKPVGLPNQLLLCLPTLPKPKGYNRLRPVRPQQMAIRIVQSKQNARVKELRATLSRPGRHDTGLVALEGIHLVAEALRSGLELETVFVAQGSEKLLEELNLGDSVEVLAMPREILASAVTTETPQPIAALARPPQWEWGQVLGEAGEQPLVVVLSGIQDPGNLGTILRSAEAFGATGAVCLPGTVSQWNLKAMRASAGSVFRMPVVVADDDECFGHLRAAGVRSFAAMAHNATPVGGSDLAGSAALIIGSEGSGLAPELATRCDARITIPCPGPVESLNAAVAASILLYEAARQRGGSQR